MLPDFQRGRHHGASFSFKRKPPRLFQQTHFVNLARIQINLTCGPTGGIMDLDLR